MKSLHLSSAAVFLSVLTAVLGQCVLATERPSARAFLVQGFPMAVGIAVILVLVASAEQGTALLSGESFRARLLCGVLTLWFGWELLETLGQAQQVCRETFSSMAVVGVLPLLLWAGWTLESSLFNRSAGVLWWISILAALVCLFSLHGQLHWENLMPSPEMSRQITLPLYAEYFVLPLLSGNEAKKSNGLVALPFAVFLLELDFTFCMELLFGSGNAFSGCELLRAGAIGQISRFDAAFLLLWLLAALYRVCVLVCILRTLLEHVWSGRKTGQEVAE